MKLGTILAVKGRDKSYFRIRAEEMGYFMLHTMRRRVRFFSLNVMQAALNFISQNYSISRMNTLVSATLTIKGTSLTCSRVVIAYRLTY